MKNKLTKFTKALLLCFVIAISSCEKDLLENSNYDNSKNPQSITKLVTLKDIPEVESFIKGDIGNISSSKYNLGIPTDNLSKASFEVNKIVLVADTIGNKNYSIRFVFNDTPENIFYNLIVNFVASGEKRTFIEKYTCDIDKYELYKNSQYDFKNFQGSVDLFRSNVFFSKSSITNKTVTDPCTPLLYGNEDPIPIRSSFIYSGSQSGTGNGSGRGDNSNGDTGWSWSPGFSWSPSTTNDAGDEGGSQGGNGCCSCGNCGLHYYPPSQANQHTHKLASNPCENIVPIGFIGLWTEPEKVQLVRAKVPISLEQWQWLHGRDPFSDVVLNYLKAAGSGYQLGEAQKNSLLAMDFCMNKTKAEYFFAMEIIRQETQNLDLNLDINASYMSPMNIDKLSITDATPEGAKFIEVYNALTKSPEFRKLFLDLFDDGNRFNVKFEIDDHVFEDNNPAKKEVNATTSQDPVTKNLTIKISKQLLIANTSMSQTNIENAKTILHECIHAYLFVKAGNPTAGTDFVKILNIMYPTPNEQHDFMYNQMIPTMQKVLGEIRDLVTTQAGRTILETLYTMRPTAITNPSASTPWIWNEYFKYLSFAGLQEASCYKTDFPKDTNQFYLLSKYIEYGNKEL